MLTGIGTLTQKLQQVVFEPRAVAPRTPLRGTREAEFCERVKSRSLMTRRSWKAEGCGVRSYGSCCMCLAETINNSKKTFPKSERAAAWIPTLTLHSKFLNLKKSCLLLITAYKITFIILFGLILLFFSKVIHPHAGQHGDIYNIAQCVHQASYLRQRSLCDFLFLCFYTVTPTPHSHSPLLYARLFLVIANTL